MRQKGFIGILYAVALVILFGIIFGTLAYAKFHKPDSAPSLPPIATEVPTSSLAPTATPRPVASSSASTSPTPNSIVTISDVSPQSIPQNYFDQGLTRYTINGTGFLAGATVQFPGAAQPYAMLQNVVVVSSTQITGTLPQGLTSGYFDVQVNNTNGTSAVLNNALLVTSQNQ